MHVSLRHVDVHVIAVPRAAPLGHLRSLDEHPAALDLHIVAEPHGVADQREVRQLDPARLIRVRVGVRVS